MFEKFAEKLKAKSQNPEITFKSYDEAVNQPEVEVHEELPAPAPKQSSIVAGARENGGNIELKVVRPESFAEVGSIADHLLAGCTVVINFEQIEESTKLRMLDFLNGVTYSTDGEIKQVSQTTFIITPNNVDVSDDEA